MSSFLVLMEAAMLVPAALMLGVAWWTGRGQEGRGAPWVGLMRASQLALGVSLLVLLAQLLLPAPVLTGLRESGWLQAGVLVAVLALLVQFLGTVIAAFSARYLQGEPGQRRYTAALATVLGAVHLLLLANHWVWLVVAWSAVGWALQRLLCFYPNRPFALLAAHKKRVADGLADALLVAAAALAWVEVGSGSLVDLNTHLAQEGATPLLQVCAVLLVLAVVLRTALLPVHGWLIQVMEAPTPVSALLHAGVVNLGGFVLIRFAPLLEVSPAARWLLIGFGLVTAVLAGFVMLTRISIKVRLAWSTVAQMGFMVLECGLGLYTLAALHLVGHSLYKAHAFLAASGAVRDTRLQMLRGKADPSMASMLVAPWVAFGVIGLVAALWAEPAWPWWWSAVLALAWAPLCWLPRTSVPGQPWMGWQALAGAALTAALALMAHLGHALPWGVTDRPDGVAGVVVLVAMAGLYLGLVALSSNARSLGRWQRWSYAGFYVDEHCTRFVLKCWPASWAGRSATPLVALQPTAPQPATK